MRLSRRIKSDADLLFERIQKVRDDFEIKKQEIKKKWKQLK